MAKKHIALGIGGAIGATIAWKLATRAATVNFEDYADKIDHAENSNFIEVDGMEVHYQEFGDPKDPKMILIHGFTASTYVWTTTAPKFADEGFHVIAVDLIGFGFSEKPSWFDYTIASQARMISRLMDHLGIGKATIIGSSYGGAVASWLTLDYPERVEKLVLVDAVINDEPKSNPVLTLLTAPGIGAVLSPFAIDSKTFLKYRMQGTLDKTSHHLITEDRIESILRPLKAADAHKALVTTARNWKANRIEEDAHLIGQPTLVVWGDHDTVIPIENGEKLYDSILNSRFVVFKDCGHVPQEEKPEMFAKLVLEFCRDRKGHLEAKESEDMELLQIEA